MLQASAVITVNITGSHDCHLNRRVMTQMCGIFISISSRKRLQKNAPSSNQKVDSHPTHAHINSFLPSFLLPLKSVSLSHSPQLGLFTTISSRLKLHSYSAPGMPAAMQQSKQSAILYHLHPWENEEGRAVVEGGRNRERERNHYGRNRQCRELKRGRAEFETSGTG